MNRQIIQEDQRISAQVILEKKIDNLRVKHLTGTKFPGRTILKSTQILEQQDFFVSSTLVILYSVPIGPSSLVCVCISVTLPGQKLYNDLEFLFDICVLLTRHS